MHADPMKLFREVFSRASRATEHDASRAALATVDARGAPDVRFVLIKEVESRGFVFYTNYESRKSTQLERQPRAALVWHWWPIGEQIRAYGQVTRASAKQSDAYFATRSRGSQLAAWASAQSRPLESREALDEAVRILDQQHEGRPVPRPRFWGGYVLTVDRMEFWTNRENRLHDRVEYIWEGTTWGLQRLAP